jgi:pentatricopeptide repeat domain-containing protein 1
MFLGRTYQPGNIFAYNATISACEKGGQWQQAVNFFEAMWTEHIVPDIVSYNAIISTWQFQLVFTFG